MPRRKSAYLSDGSDSGASDDEGSEGGFNSQEDGDSRAERALFEHKRQKFDRGAGKESAWEGIFGEDDYEQETRRGLGGSKRKRKDVKPGARSDLSKAPTFVAQAPKTSLDEERKPHDSDDRADDGSDDDADEDAKSEEGDSDNNEDDNDIDTDDDLPARGTLNSGNGTNDDGRVEDDQPTAGIGNRRGGIGSSARTMMQQQSTSGSAGEVKSNGRRGLGFSKASHSEEENTSTSSTPFANFGRQPQHPAVANSIHREKFASRSPTPAANAPGAHTLTSAEKAHFSRIAGDFGARMLAKQGWSAGKGLGVTESGRAVPIEVGKLMMGEGIRSGIRTEDSKREARRMGHKVEDEEEEQAKRGRVSSKRAGNRAPAKDKVDDGWKRERKVKVRVEHKTYEQLIAEAGDQAQAGVGLVLDARSGELRQVQSVSELTSSSWSPTSDKTQLPELRHNLRLVFDMTKNDVDNLAREGKSVVERRRWSLREVDRARNTIESNSQRIDRLGSIEVLLTSINFIAQEESTKSNPSISPLAESVETLLASFKEEYSTLSLDEAVVGAVGQILRKTFTTWQPFDVSSDAILSALKPLSDAFNLSTRDVKATVRIDESGSRSMSPWESLLWNMWLPRVRSTFNNEWDAQHPLPAVHFLESWNPILPASIRDNLIDQLILPKITAAVERWDTKPTKPGKHQRSLAGIIFPWLPLLDNRVNGLLDEGKRRIRSLLRHWNVSDGVPSELQRWKKDVYTSSEWDKLMGEFVLGKLGTCLRDDLIVNPRNQDMTPLEQHVLPWYELIRPSSFARLLELEFFPKWLNILYLWLVHPGYNGDEVASWFQGWKRAFPEALLEDKRVAHGFDSGLKLMADALHLGSAAPAQLPKPTFSPLSSSKGVSTMGKRQTISRPAVAEPTEITFRTIVEEFVIARELLFLPLGRSHVDSGKPLFRVAKTFEGRGGVTVYVGNDAVYAQAEDGSFRAISLEDLVKRADV